MQSNYSAGKVEVIDFVETRGFHDCFQRFLVWVHADSATLRARLAARGEARDAGKLADFDAFVTRMRPTEPPVVPHLAVDNSSGAAPLAEQLDALLLRSPPAP